MKRSPSLFTHTLFVLSLLAASVTLPAPAMSGEVVYDLTKGGAGTFFEGGTFTSWIPLGSLPAGSFLQSVSINTVLDSTNNENWTCELSILFDPTPATPGGDGVLEFSGWDNLGSVERVQWVSGWGGAGTAMVENKYAGVDWFNNIDLNTTEVFFKNVYGGPVTGGVWSGTVKLKYGAPARELTWTGGTSEWSTGPVTNWKDGASVPTAYVDGDKVLFDDSVGGSSRIVNISGAPVTPAGVTFNSAATYTLTGAAIAGDGGLTKNGDGTLIVQNVNTYAGLTKINAGTLGTGTLKIGVADALPHGAGKDIVLINGTLDLNGYSTTLNGLGGSISGRVTNSGAGNVTLTLGDGDQSGTFAGAIENGSGKVSLEKIGNGTQTLNGVSSYTGKTSVREGTLNLGTSVYLSNAGVAGPLGMPTGADATIDLYNGTTLRMGSTEPRENQATDRTINLAGNGPGTVSIKVNDNDTSFTFGSVMATGSGAKTLALSTGYEGNGDREEMTFNGPITDVTGDSSPLSLQVTFNTRTASSSCVNLVAGGTFTGPITLIRGNAVSWGYLVIGGRLANVFFENNTFVSSPGSGQLDGGHYAGAISLDTNTILYYNSTANQILSGGISGAGGLTMGGPGTLTVSGDNSYRGLTKIVAGALSINSIKNANSGSSALGNPATVADGTIHIGSGDAAGKLVYTGGAQETNRVINLAGSTGGATIEQSGAGLLKFTSALTATGNGAKTLTLQGSSAGTGEIAGAIVNNSGTNKTSLIKAGISTWTLSGDNTYTGTTSVQEGRLVANHENALGGALGGAVTVAGGGTLALGADIAEITTGPLTMQAGSVYESAIRSGTTADRVSVNGNLTLDSAWKLKLMDIGIEPTATQKYDLFTYSGIYTGPGSFGPANIDAGTTVWIVSDATIVAGGGRVYITGLSALVPGDTNSDGVVDAADYITLTRNFGQSANSGPSYGDFNDSGATDWNDLQILMNAMNGGGTGGASATTPEPATLGLLAIGALAVLRRRRA